MLGPDLLLLAANQRLAVIKSGQSRFDACFDLHKFVTPFYTALKWENVVDEI